MADKLQVAGVRLVVEGASEYQEVLRSSNQEMKLSQVEMKKLAAAYGDSDKSAEKLSKVQAELNRQMEAQKKRIDTLRQARAAYSQQENASKTTLDKLDLAISKEELTQIGLERQLRETTQEITAQEAAVAQAAQAQEDAARAGQEEAAAQEAAKAETAKHSEELEKQKGILAKLTNGLQDAARQADAWGDKMIKSGQKIEQAGGKMTRNVTLPIVAGLTFAAKELIDFENAYADVRKTVNGSPLELDELEKDLLSMSESLPQTKEEIASVAATGGQLGVATMNLQDFAKTMLNMGVATNMGATEAAEGMAQFINITQAGQDKFDEMGSTIVALGNNLATQEKPILEMGLRIAAAGKQAGISDAKILGFSAALASVGIEAEAGGSAISKVILNMDMAAAKGGKSLKGYANVAGMTVKEFQSLWKADAAGALVRFIQGLQGIDQAGGNVAVTLEKLGYNEVRTRDALLRAVGAGDLFAGALDLANSAWEENNALTEEADKKNQTMANRLKILGNRASLTAQGFGEAMVPALETVLAGANGLVDAFDSLDDGEKMMIVNSLAMVAAIGPVVRGVGTLTQGVGYLGKAFSFLAGPHGWIALAAVGLAGAAIALANVKTAGEKVDEALSNIQIKVDSSSVAGITADINTGIAAAEKIHSITVEVEAQTKGISIKQDEILEDGKVTKKEYKSISKYIDEVIGPDIDTAKANLEAKVQGLRDALAGATDADGNPLYTQEQQEAMVAAVQEKTNNLIAELEGYQTNYNNLMETLYKERRSPTEAELGYLNDLLAKIGLVQVELKKAQDDALLRLESDYDMTIAGKGSNDTYGGAVAYVKSKQSADLKTAEQTRDASLIAAQGLESEQAALNASTEAWDTYKASVAGINEKAQEDYIKVLDGIAASSGDAATQLQNASDAYIKLATINAMYNSDGLDDVEVAAIFTPEVIAKYMGDTTLTPENAKELLADSMNVDVFMGVLREKLAKEIETAGNDSDLNPLFNVLQSMLDSGSLDGLDVTKVTGALEGLLQISEAKVLGEELGTNIVEGVDAGIGYGAKALDATQTDALRDAVLMNLRTSFDSHSPARETIPVGEDISAGVGVGIANGGAVVGQAAAGLKGNVMVGLAGMDSIGIGAGNTLMDGLLAGIQEGSPEVMAEVESLVAGIRSAMDAARQAASTLDFGALNYLGDGEAVTKDIVAAKSGGTINNTRASTVDNSSTTIVEHMEVRKESDIYSISTELASIRKRQLAALGFKG